MKHTFYAAYAALAAIALASCTGGTSESDFLTVNGSRFVDAQQRTIILNGVNHVVKDLNAGFMFSDADDEALFRQFRAWGFSCVRYGIFWEAIEPEPGSINEAYLAQLDKRVKWAADNGIWLVLDMHQDLYGRAFGSNGAPRWATVNDSLTFDAAKSSVWSDAYFFSPAVQKAFDSFWSNAPAPDGIGIQDHYISVWRTLAARYASSPAVAGFDLMNEPAMGSPASLAFRSMMVSYAGIVAQQTGKVPTEAQLMATWSNLDLRMEALQQLDNKEIFAAFVDGARGVSSAFEQGLLGDFYQRLRDAIRDAGSRQILFLEHDLFCNFGTKSSLRIPTDASGTPDPLCAYAPHGYDLSTDTRYAATQGLNRLDAIFSSIFATAAERNLPVLLGEWGAYYAGSGDCQTPAVFTAQKLEQALAGQTYWQYWSGIDTQNYFSPALSRSYPLRVNGKLVAYSNDYASKTFSCEWDEDPSNPAPTLVYLNAASAKAEGMELLPAGQSRLVPTAENAASAYLEIAPIGKSRTLKIDL